jgi:hypothetical protein
MGYAQGTLMLQEARSFINDVWTYFEQQVQQRPCVALCLCVLLPAERCVVAVQVEEYLAGIPNWLSEDVANFGLDVALDMTAQWTANYTGTYFFEELQGA